MIPRLIEVPNVGYYEQGMNLVTACGLTSTPQVGDRVLALGECNQLEFVTYTPCQVQECPVYPVMEYKGEASVLVRTTTNNTASAITGSLKIGSDPPLNMALLLPESTYNCVITYYPTGHWTMIVEAGGYTSGIGGSSPVPLVAGMYAIQVTSTPAIPVKLLTGGTLYVIPTGRSELPIDVTMPFTLEYTASGAVVVDILKQP